MRVIKTKSRVSDVNNLTKTVRLPARLKESLVRQKASPEETSESGASASAAAVYATDKVETSAQETVIGVTRRLPGSPPKTREYLRTLRTPTQRDRTLIPKGRYVALPTRQSPATRNGSAGSLRRTAMPAQHPASRVNTSAEQAKKAFVQRRARGRLVLQRTGRDTGAPFGEEIAGTSLRIDSPDNKQPLQIPTRHSPLSDGISTRFPSPIAQVKPSTPSARAHPMNRSQTSIQIKSIRTGRTASHTVKSVSRGIKTADRSVKTATTAAQQIVKGTPTSAQWAARTAATAQKITQVASKTAAHSARAAVKGATALAKAAIAAVRGLVAVIAAGSSLTLALVLVTCMAALFIGSVFGLFLSGQPHPDTGQTIRSAIAGIDAEYTAGIEDILASYAYSSLVMSGSRSPWREVLAVYAVRSVTDPEHPMEVAVMDADKAAALRVVFWDMHTVSHWLETVTHTSSYTDDEGETVSSKWYEYILHISVTYKRPEEMAEQYGFDDAQNEWLAELLKPEYDSLWSALLYGTAPGGGGSMLETAQTHLGTIGGEVFWRWYGFTERVQWCAIFVSWAAEQCGYIEAGLMPLFSACSDGIAWFADRGQWQDSDYVPAPGDIIFFDWESDGEPDHVGIVESVSDGVVTTIEGNSGDAVARRQYSLGDVRILGYGLPAYDLSITPNQASY